MRPATHSEANPTLSEERGIGFQDQKRSFLRMVSHELRTPLNSILGFSEILAAELYGPLSDAERSDANKVRGCASQVWLVTEPQADGTLKFRGDSDAHIVRGLIALLLRLYSGHAPADILAFDAPAAFAKLGLSGALSMQRSNGLASMVARIRRDAEAAG
jgi:cysteine desulfuration protein SufE